MPEVVDLLVEGDFLLPMTEGMPVITGAQVAVRAGRIVASTGSCTTPRSWRRQL